MELFKSRTRVAYTNAVGDKVYPVIVDIKRGIKSTEEIQFMSSDINTGILSVAFIQGNDNYNVSGAEVVCSVMRPDASTLDIPCTSVEDNIVEVPLGINGTSQDGIYSFDFKVFKGGNKVVGTPIMNYSVSLSISNDMVVEEDDRLPVLTMLMTQVTELKDEAREVINQANTATEATKVATANAIEATNNVNATINTANQKMLDVDNAKNEMTTTVTNKVNEVEGRFNALTASQQQSSEVIDARDGEVSLKARLDRDIEKANKELDKIKKLEESTVSTVETESDFTTVEATSNGYFEDVKLEGKTLVNLGIEYYHKNVTSQEFIPSLVTATTRCTKEINIGGEFTVISNLQFWVSEIDLSGNVILQSNWYDASNGYLYKTSENCSRAYFVFRKFDNSAFTSKEEFKALVLEGDHTQNPPSYFEGLMSVGEDVDEIVVSSVNENLTKNHILHEVTRDNYSVKIDSINISKLKIYNPFNRLVKAVILNNGSWIRDVEVPPNTINDIILERGEYVRFINFPTYIWTDATCDYVSLSKYVIIASDSFELDKKQLLFYNNETQTWEKPILREWDSIEKHSDGKYYYHQRSGEVVLNGSENWNINNNSTNHMRFSLNVDCKVGILYAISDKFSYVGDSTTKETIFTYRTNGQNHGVLVICIDKTKLSTQDVAGFKQWLQANNVTVVYQLAQEKVYECTNIDLITYANETNYIVECGAIAPKSILKVHNNISNVVKILQEKVSLLESNVKASQEVQDMMILETDMRMLDIELALMEFVPMKLNLGGSDMLRSATYFNFVKNHIINETYEKEYLENVMNKYLATGRINQDEYDELYKMLYPPVYDIELPIEP